MPKTSTSGRSSTIQVTYHKVWPGHLLICLVAVGFFVAGCLYNSIFVVPYLQEHSELASIDCEVYYGASEEEAYWEGILFSRELVHVAYQDGFDEGFSFLIADVCGQTYSGAVPYPEGAP